MAQRYMGANNLALLKAKGQFGTRAQGGRDHASPRYLYTELDALTRQIFKSEDDDLLAYRDDDGAAIEPEWFVPVIPMVLVNGADGIGTGFSTSIPSYNPIDLIQLLRRRLTGSSMGGLVPWVRGFRGTVSVSGERSEIITYTGSVRLTHQTDKLFTYQISELPPGMTTDSYKEFLTEACTREAGGGGGGGGSDEDGESSGPSSLRIKRYTESHQVDTVAFTVQLTADQHKYIESFGSDPASLAEAFRLISTRNLTNMHLFDPSGKMERFDSPIQIIERFFPLRLEFYRKRKALLTRQREEAYK